LKKQKNLDHPAVTEQLQLLYLTKEKLAIDPRLHQNILDNINRTIEILEIENKNFLEEKAKFLCLRAKAKWYEDGERSNKYFLNIIKKRSEQTTITKLSSEQNIYENQQDIMNFVTEFYQDLYNMNETDDNYHDFLAYNPKLSDEDRLNLDKEITLEELKSVVNGCGDSAPGPDGLPYKVYRKMWQILGRYLLDA